MNKPLIFCDLDDTLFQTKRKMSDETGQNPVRIAALDRSLLPRSFMTEEQAMLVDWLLATAELIPVTARGTQETARVSIPFSSWKVMAHGAVIANPDGAINDEWAHIMKTALRDIRERLLSCQAFVSAALLTSGVNAWCRMNYEYDHMPVCFVMKHRDSTRIEELSHFNTTIMRTLDTSGFHIHQNDNNIAWVPDCVQKGLAVEWLLTKLRKERGSLPVLGLGDSISDHSFMKHCNWYGMPSHSQFATAISQKLL